MITIGDLLLQALLGALVTAGFGMLFNVPRNTLIRAVIVGTTGHIFRFTLRSVGVTNEVATLLGAFTVGVFGYWNTHQLRMPRAIITVTGIITMIPGIPAYEMIIYFFHGDTVNGLQSVVKAVILAGSIAAGLSLARIITAPEFRI